MGEKMTTVRHCPICLGSIVKEIHRHRFVLFEDHPLAGDCVTVICQNCGMAFNQATASSEAYVSYYTSLSKYINPASFKILEPRFIKLADIFSTICPDRNLSILDAGSGSGGFLACLRMLGYKRLTAMDPAPGCVEFIRRELDIEAKVGTLDNSPFSPESFDVVISTGVFEHLLSPISDLAAINKLLVSGGERGGAFIVVPDASRYVDFLDAPFNEFNIEHINHFSSKTLTFLFELHGWSVKYIGYDELYLSPKWVEPIIYGLFNHDNSQNNSIKLNLNHDFNKKIDDYIFKSIKLLNNIDKKLNNSLSKVDEVILWGSGQLSSLLLSQTILAKIKLFAVLDSNPAYLGHHLVGSPVGGPELKGTFGGPIVIASIRSHNSIRKMIKEQLGWKNEIISLI
jgi:SAM-dependent methyltransferase